MSTIAYGAITRKREQAERGLSSTSAPPGIGFWIDSMTAIVPAEVLIIQAGILSAASTKTRELPFGNAVVTLTNPDLLRVSFVVLLLMGPMLYVGAHVLPVGLRQWHGADWFRMAVPALAFLAWALAQRGSALDAWIPEIDDLVRFVIAAVIGIGLIVVVGLLAWQASVRTLRPLRATKS